MNFKTTDKNDNKYYLALKSKADIESIKMDLCTKYRFNLMLMVILFSLYFVYLFSLNLAIFSLHFKLT